jgi:predicted exporter
MVSKQSALAWLVILIGVCSMAAYQIANHWRMQTDILALLPQDEHEPTLQTIRHIVSGELGRTALFLVGHAQPHIARIVTHQLGTLMHASGLFSVVRWDYSKQPQAFFALYFPLRYRVISPTLRPYLDSDDGYKYLIERVKQALYQPMSSVATRFLEQDPLLFFPELLKDFGTSIMQINHSADVNAPSLQQHESFHEKMHEDEVVKNITMADGMLGTRRHGRSYYFIMAQLAANPFEEKSQTQLEEHWQQWSNNLRHTTPDLELTYTAVARLAASMRHHMQQDMFFISVGSTLGILLLIIMTFRSVQQLVIAFIPLVLGLWSAAGVSLLIFTELHAFTLVFGASLLGVCIDYSLHYFAYHRMARQWEPIAAMRRILPALSLGMFTTILSYIGLGFTPLVGLRQMAVFASCGILVSFFTVVFWSPFFLRHAHPMVSHSPLLYKGSQSYLILWSRYKKSVWLLLALLVALCIKGLCALRVSDSPLVLKTLPEDVTEQDRIIRNMMGISEAQQYLVIDGKTPEEVLHRLEQFQDYVRTESGRYRAAFGPMLTSFLPSKQRQEDNARSVKRLLAHAEDIANELSALGLPERSIHNFFRDLAREPGTLLLPETWLHHEVSVGLRNFWLYNTADEASIAVKLHNTTDVHRIKESIAAFDGIRYFDHIESFTRILEQYRKSIMLLVIGAYAVVLAILLWRYRLKGCIVMLPPCLAAGIAVGFLGLIGHTLHLLHWLALLLVLGMGVDYAIFLAESDPASEAVTFLALTLAAMTTILSFGLLSFSSQAALQAIGLTTFVGTLCAWLLSPLARYGRVAS